MKPEVIAPHEEGEIPEIEVVDLDLQEDLFNLCLPCCGPSFINEP